MIAHMSFRDQISPCTLKRIVDLSFLIDIGANFFTGFYDNAKLDVVWDHKVPMQKINDVYLYT